jgi:hypothetical protein
MWNMNITSSSVEGRWWSIWESICRVVKQYVMVEEWKLVLHDGGIGNGDKRVSVAFKYCQGCKTKYFRELEATGRL